jgi:hypothetical protein
VSDSELLAHHAADVEEGLCDRGQPRKAHDQLADPRLVSKAIDGTYLQTKVAQRPAQIGLHVEQLR